MASSVPTAPGELASGSILQRIMSGRQENLLLCLAISVFALYPLVDELFDIGRLGSMGSIMIYVLLAMGLNIVVGYAGLLDLGYAAFFAIGAYTMGLLTSPKSFFIKEGYVPEWLQHFWPALAVSWVVAAIFGVLLGAPTLRLRGDYLAIVTLGFGEIVPNFFLNAEKITNGTLGLNPVGKPSTFTIFGHKFAFAPTDQDNWYWLILAICVLSLFMIRRFYNSRLGRTWQAVREDEIAAASMGVNLVRTKLWAFALGASFAGFAGSLSAAYFQYVHPANFEFIVSITILSMVVLGGIGNIYGVIAGALLIGFFDRILTEELTPPLNSLGDALSIDFLANHNLTQDKFLIFGLALVLTMLLRPEGLFPSARRKAEFHPEEDKISEHEQQQMYDIREMDEPAVGERA
ncbi:MAG: branched-chain amino acid ABC transporter permease [Thermomicrobiales bacterium]|jgi:branched-chain amino acid transport system permease protein|nr:branched-chain amino acid ABC transporter permease [Thermomicrobiales bacterium]